MGSKMSQHGNPAECDPACVKIILNGGRVAGEIKNIVGLVMSGMIHLNEAEAYQLIDILDEAEDKLIEFNNRVLAKTGYQRRTDKFQLGDLSGA